MAPEDINAPVQIRVPNTQGPDCADECRYQSRLAAQADLADVDMLQFMDDALADIVGYID